MEQSNKSGKAPVISIVALILGIVCIALCVYLETVPIPNPDVTSMALINLFLDVYAAVGILTPLCGLAAIITGIIGLKRSKRLSCLSKKGICISTVAIIAGSIETLFFLILIFLPE
ncbi:MAG: hypothetical protein IJL62_03725 [Clostridia bacterium]|nr:hypothetical protein [Clostridia bacterium]